MKNFVVRMPMYGVVHAEVSAEDEEDAIDKVQEMWPKCIECDEYYLPDSEDYVIIEELEAVNKIIEGNVFYGALNKTIVYEN